MNTINEKRNGRFSSFLTQYQLSLFFVLTLALSALIATIAVRIGNENISILTVFTPTIIAFILTAFVNGKAGLHELFVKQTKQRFKLPWLFVAVLLFPILAVIAITLYAQFGGAPLTLRSTQLFPQMLLILLIGLGEEYGWRGFALPKLQQKQSALVASLILGLVWGFWHFPGYLIGVGVPLDMTFDLFMVWVIGATILMTWVYNNTQSVLLSILMHMSANAAFNYLELLPEFTGDMFTFGLFLGVVWVCAILVIIFFSPTTMTRHPQAE